MNISTSEGGVDKQTQMIPHRSFSSLIDECEKKSLLMVLLLPINTTTRKIPKCAFVSQMALN